MVTVALGIDRTEHGEQAGRIGDRSTKSVVAAETTGLGPVVQVSGAHLIVSAWTALRVHMLSKFGDQRLTKVT